MELCVLWDKAFIDVSTTDVATEDGWEYYLVIKGWYILTVLRFIQAVSKFGCFINPIYWHIYYVDFIERKIMNCCFY
jgi:hypothetical protein